MAVVRQKSARCVPLAQDDVDTLITSLLHHMVDQDELINAVDGLIFVTICHQVAIILDDEGSLEYVHDSRGVAVIGDIHSSFADLMKAFQRTGMPNRRTLLFLGNYTCRGPNPIEVLLLLFLLKIRFPHNIVLLRGNHETLEQCIQFGLEEKLLDEYGSLGRLLFYNIICIFDSLPLAAIISDQIFCCHGGISQFLSSREDVASIPKPSRWLNESVTIWDILITTDLLWADPTEIVEELREPFTPSDRSISYKFSQEALAEKLRQLNCRGLVRGHQPVAQGFAPSFGGLCITVHSSKNYDQAVYNAAVLLLDFDPVTGLVDSNAELYPAGAHDCYYLLDTIREFEEKYAVASSLYRMPVFMVPGRCPKCTIWKMGIQCRELHWQRCFSHSKLLEIMEEYRDVPSKVQYYLDILDADVEEHKEWLAAKLFPEFLEELLAEKKIRTRAKRRRRRNSVAQGVVYKLPKSPQ